MTSGRPPSICILVPTTARPIPIVQLSPYPALEHSTVVSEWVEDHRVAETYRMMLQPLGTIGRLLPEVGKQRFALVLAERIDTGLSWQLPVLCAHLVLAAGHALAGDPDKADIVVWATGAIAMDIAADASSIPIERHDYALGRKLAATSDMFERVAARGGRILILLPPDTEELAAPPDRDATTLHQVARVSDVVTILSDLVADAGPAQRERRSKTACVARWFGMRDEDEVATTWLQILPEVCATGLVALLVAGAIHQYRDERPAPSRPPVGPDDAASRGEPAAPAPTLRRLTATGKATCLNVRWGWSAPDATVWPDRKATGDKPEEGEKALCGVEIEPPEGWTIGGVSGLADIEIDPRSRQFSPAKVVVMFRKDKAWQPREATVGLVDANGRRRDVSFHVPGWKP